MSQRRIELGNKLKTILGNNNTYFQPPENLKMKYPCARYNVEGYNQRHADDEIYKADRRYMVMFITSTPENDYYDAMMDTFKYCRFDRQYIADGLYHYVYTLYY